MATALYRVEPSELDKCRSFDVYLAKLKVWEFMAPQKEDVRCEVLS